jgi:hypothetical protein
MSVYIKQDVSRNPIGNIWLFVVTEHNPQQPTHIWGNLEGNKAKEQKLALQKSQNITTHKQRLRQLVLNCDPIKYNALKHDN